MRKTPALIVIVLLALCSWPGVPSAQRGPTISADLHAARARGERVRVIVQGGDSTLQTLRGRLRGLLRRDLGSGLALDLSPAEFDRLSRDSSIAHLSGDLPVAADMALTNRITAASSVWQSTSGGLLGLFSTSGYDGTGVGVAVIDSGIAASHTALGGRVVARVNMVSWEADAPGDAFGHGTHIAGAIAGSTTAANRVTNQYGGGSAPGVRLVDVRVLGRTGVGLTSDVIAGIDWAIANRTRYNIRVMSLALGHPVTEPSITDPLCRAVARAAAANIVVVASAGNYGRTPAGAPVLGGITSPGNSPAALTVGAIEANGTIDRSDDRVADYSSRGPTRFEFAVKPDVVAPGTRLISLEAQGSYLSSTYPQWHIAGSGRNAYMRLSGSSMATGVVAGGVALLLDANPRLSPAQVKAALQMGATFVPEGGLIGGGAGTVNFAASMKLANTDLLSSLLGTVDTLLGTSSGATFRDTGTLIDRVYDGTGIQLLGILDLGRLFSSLDSAESGVLHLLGLSNPLARVPANQLVWGEVADWSSSYYLVWGNTVQSPSGQYLVWGNTDYTGSSYLVWGNAVVPPDADSRR
ncbi:MAG TPA: S8 family serine peptidase [Vicinamibacterales bacterium]|nr:S8 family serine peptidase [Vicinamibacterales bacterium]